MRTPKKSDKTSGKKSATGAAKLSNVNASTPNPKNKFNEDDDEFDVPLDDLDDLENFGGFDDDDDY